MRIDVAGMAARIGLYLQRTISEGQITAFADVITAHLHNGGSMEVRGQSLRVPPLRVRQMITSFTTSVPAGQSTIALPDDFLDGNEALGDRTDFEQVTLRDLSVAAAKYSAAGTPPGDRQFRSGPRPLLAFTGVGFQTFSYEPTDATIWYWGKLTDPINGRRLTNAILDSGHIAPGGPLEPFLRRVPEYQITPGFFTRFVIDDNHALILEPDIYFKGIAAYIAQETQDDEKKNEQWIAFKGSVDALNSSQSENSGVVAPRHVYRSPIGGKR